MKKLTHTLFISTIAFIAIGNMVKMYAQITIKGTIIADAWGTMCDAILLVNGVEHYTYGEYTITIPQTEVPWSGTIEPRRDHNDFICHITHLIQGNVRDDEGNGICAIEIYAVSAEKDTFKNLEGGIPTTNVGGWYRVKVVPQWYGTITPVLQGYAFDPPFRSYDYVSMNYDNQDFTGYLMPDLIIQNLNITPVSGYPGDNIVVDFIIENQGGAATSGVFDNMIMWSADTVIGNEGDRILETLIESNTIEAGFSKNYSQVVTLPSDLMLSMESFKSVQNTIPSSSEKSTTRSGYIGVYADKNESIAEIDENNNTAATEFILLTNVEKDNNTIIPVQFQLYANLPNPFNPETTIQFDLPKACNVTLGIYNIRGQEIIQLLEEWKSAGRYRVIWNGKDELSRQVPSGIYIYKIHTTDFTKSRKLVLSR